MIRYSLKCDQGHAFDSWFASSAAYDRLAAAGQLSCAICGTAAVDKALMAPAVAMAPDAPPPAVQVPAPAPAAPPAPSLRTPATPVEAALAALRAHVEANSEYVGVSFATEARAIHDGLARERPIWGEARPDEARALIEDGLPVAPLPFLPTRKAN